MQASLILMKISHFYRTAVSLKILANEKIAHFGGHVLGPLWTGRDFERQMVNLPQPSNHYTLSGFKG